MAKEITNEVLIADALLRLRALESLLITKGIITEKEFEEQLTGLTNQITKVLLQKANVPGDLDDIIAKLKKS